jgi:hypothetical protein
MTLWRVKDLLKSHGDEWTTFSAFSPIILLAPELSLLTGAPDSTGGCQSALVDKLRVSPNRYHHAMVHIAVTWGRSSETSVSLHHNQSTYLRSALTVQSGVYFVHGAQSATQRACCPPMAQQYRASHSYFQHCLHVGGVTEL